MESRADNPAPLRKLLILSYAFAPATGGIETVSGVLARSFAERGYEVVVVTSVAADGPEVVEPFRVIRHPGAGKLIGLIRWADLVLQSNTSLSLAWPLWILFPRKPFIVVHHTPLSHPDGSIRWQDRLKRMSLGRPCCLSVSSYLAGTMETPSKVIHNPYQETVFHPIPGIARSREILFVGRLVQAKGVDTLLQAFRLLLNRRPETRLTIVGSGPEEGPLRALAESLQIAGQVDFLGPKRAEELARLMNEHLILAVPSRSHPPEALPVVPIEAIACGMVPVASRQGGMAESIGEAGVLVEEGNIEELAEAMLTLLNDPESAARYRQPGQQHLRLFSTDAVIAEYESHFAACMAGK